MKRRDFIIQSLSASAVVASAGYASLDMFLRRSSPYRPDIEARATQATLEVPEAFEAIGDEGLLTSPSPALQLAEPPASPVHSRPAVSYAQQQKAESLTPSEFPQAPVAQNEPFPAVGPQPEPVEEIVLSEADKEAAEKAKIAVPVASAQTTQEKINNFEQDFTDDVILIEDEYRILVQTLERINRVQRYVGFGNFNLISLDDAMKYANSAPQIGAFTAEEKAFLEMLFYADSSRLGFYGDKVVDNPTNIIATSDVVKVPKTGHFVYRGHSEEFYYKIRNEIGPTLILTSGVRNIVKQSQLFLAKVVHASGNMSRASRSLAPPGHSYHAVGDFDVGQVGAGLSNFTAAFAETDEFKKLQSLGYVRIRYTADNKLGVRYEPWHIRVV
ncbi:M15 family metallopeptidase [Reinekea thalattae]|uniref:M15 family metallopeptidase n=1 Tax=Reinekea thalattae TaxID=2593301 RepID=UPI00164FD5D8|nr:M15 family metallopeptidase [Reinekea thalattae]